MKLVRDFISVLGIISLFLVTFSFAHLCHDPFRPRQRLMLIPEKDLIRIEETGRFRMYVENNFHSTLRDVQLFIESPAFNIEVQPQVLKNLLPGERTFFIVSLRLKEGLKSGDYPLKISVKARSAELRPSVEEIDVIVEEEVPEEKVESMKEVEPKDINAEHKEEIPQEVGRVVVKVEKIPFWKRTYFYIVFILLLVGILIWRKIKLR